MRRPGGDASAPKSTPAGPRGLAQGSLRSAEDGVPARPGGLRELTSRAGLKLQSASTDDTPSFGAEAEADSAVRDSLLDRIASGGALGSNWRAGGEAAAGSHLEEEPGDLAGHLRASLRFAENELRNVQGALEERHAMADKLKKQLVREKFGVWRKLFHIDSRTVLEKWREATERGRHDTELLQAHKLIDDKERERTEKMRKVLDALGSHGSALEKSFQGWKINLRLLKPMDDAIAKLEEEKNSMNMSVDEVRKKQVELENEVRAKDKEITVLRMRKNQEAGNRRDAEENLKKHKQVSEEAVALVRAACSANERRLIDQVAETRTLAEDVRATMLSYTNSEGGIDTLRIAEALARIIASSPDGIDGGAHSLRQPAYPPLLPRNAQERAWFEEIPWRQKLSPHSRSSGPAATAASSAPPAAMTRESPWPSQVKVTPTCRTDLLHWASSAAPTRPPVGG